MHVYTQQPVSRLDKEVDQTNINRQQSDLIWKLQHVQAAIFMQIFFFACFHVRPGLNVAFYMRRIELPN